MKYIFQIIILFTLASCSKRYIVNEAGAIRPFKKDVFSYHSRFNTFPSQIDTNAIYLRHWQYQSINGVKDAYEYFRFFSGGQIIYSGLDSVLNLSNVDNLNKGMIGRYYFKRNQLRIQLFYKISNSRSICKAYGFVKDNNIYIYDETPETWFSSYGLTKWFGKKEIQVWEKQNMTLKSLEKPNW